MDYSQLQLNETIFKGIQEAGYVTCTPVQEKVLEVSLDGSDLYVQSQTGTGKTAAFLITIMQQLLSGGKANSKNALVLVPTRELAVQVEEEAEKLGKYTGLTMASFYGGVGYEKQIEKLNKGVDIIIGTPGRIIDLNTSKKMDLSKVGYLAIDEADRMFDMGFYPDLRKIVKFLPDSADRQTMLFSATLNSYVKNLAWEYTKDAKEINIESQNITVDEIDQELIHVSSDDKMRLLTGILKRENPESLIIFCNTKKMCEVLSKRMELNGIKNEFIIGDLPQSKRLKIMNAFKAGKLNCLIATDVAARGIDVSDLAMVINWDLPNEAENYVHRIGRTARAGKSGKAYTFCSEQDVYSLMPIERYIEKQIPSRIAYEEDFGEDLSKDKWIKTGSWKDEEGSGKRSGRPAKGRRNGEKADSKRNAKFNNNRKNEGQNKKFKNSRTQKSDKNELDKLSGMTSEQRMRYYKEKYAKTGAKPNSRKTNKVNKQEPKKGLFAKIKSLFGKK